MPVFDRPLDLRNITACIAGISSSLSLSINSKICSVVWAEQHLFYLFHGSISLADRKLIIKQIEVMQIIFLPSPPILLLLPFIQLYSVFPQELKAVHMQFLLQFFPITILGSSTECWTHNSLQLTLWVSLFQSSFPPASLSSSLGS